MANSNSNHPTPATWHLWAYHRAFREWRPAGQVQAHTQEAAVNRARLAGILGYIRAEPADARYTPSDRRAGRVLVDLLVALAAATVATITLLWGLQ